MNLYFKVWGCRIITMIEDFCNDWESKVKCTEMQNYDIALYEHGEFLLKIVE